MKKVTLFLSLLLVAAFLGSCDKEKTEQTEQTGKHKGHEFVDLGLPSGTLWATCNVGAENPWDYGDYFAWGETNSKSEYSLENYFDYAAKEYKKYNNGKDGKKELDEADDVAHVKWKGNWRMPSKKQFEELVKECYWVWTDSYGKDLVSGYIVYKAKSEDDKGKRKSSSNSTIVYRVAEDAHIFLPAAGYRFTGFLYYEGDSAVYWSRSLSEFHSYNAWYLYFNSGYVVAYYGLRYYGRSVRPVCLRAD